MFNCVVLYVILWGTHFDLAYTCILIFFRYFINSWECEDMTIHTSSSILWFEMLHVFFITIILNGLWINCFSLGISLRNGYLFNYNNEKNYSGNQDITFFPINFHQINLKSKHHPTLSNPKPNPTLPLTTPNPWWRGRQCCTWNLTPTPSLTQRKTTGGREEKVQASCLAPL